MKLSELSLHQVLTKWNHEVRSPFTSIFGLMTMLEDEISDGNTSEALRLMKRLNVNAQRIFNFTNLVLEYAKIDQGEIKLNFNAIKPYYELNFIVENLSNQESFEETKVIIKSFDNEIEMSYDGFYFEKIFQLLLKVFSKITKEIFLEIIVTAENTKTYGVKMSGNLKDNNFVLIDAFRKGIIEDYIDKTKFNVIFGIGMIIFEKYINKLGLKYELNLKDNKLFELTIFFNQ